MVSSEKVLQKFTLLEEYLQLLQEISKKPKNHFLRDKILIGSAKYYLQVSIECCLDVANHIIASESFRAPKNYADAFQVLAEQKILDSELATRLQQMAKFRNRLVHLYGEVDDEFVFKALTEDLKDIFEFKKTIVETFKP